MAVMNTRTAAPTNQALAVGGVPSLQGAPVVAATGAGGMSPTAVPSPVSTSMSGMTSPHQTGIGMKPGTQAPSPNVLQVVKQVRLN